jgi:hypothetical protein
VYCVYLFRSVPSDPPAEISRGGAAPAALSHPRGRFAFTRPLALGRFSSWETPAPVFGWQVLCLAYISAVHNLGSKPKLFVYLFISSELSRSSALPCSPRSSTQRRESRDGKSLGRTRMHGSGKLMRVLQAGCRAGGAGVDLRVLRGARKRSTIWARGPGKGSSALTQPKPPDARPRGGLFH